VVSFSRGMVRELGRKAGSGVEGLEGEPLTGFQGVLRGVPELIASIPATGQPAGASV